MGRPKHPDILTPREWEVLALLREGRSNDEIAEALGVTVATARFHVSEILSKLGVANRGEAAAWQPERRRWTWAFSPLAVVHRLKWQTAAATLGALMTVAALAVIALLAWGASRSGLPSAGSRLPVHHDGDVTDCD